MAIDPLAVPSLLDGLEHHDVAIGCRALRDSMVETTYVVRTLMGRLFNEIVTTGTGLGLKDTQCGFKAFRAPVGRLLFHLVRIDRFAFDVEILTRARRLGLGITEVPVHWKHVEGSTVHPLHDSFAMVSDVYRSRRGRLAGPPVDALTVTPRTFRPTAARRSSGRSPTCSDRSSITHRCRCCTTRTGVTVLLAMVDPLDVGRAHVALHDGLASAEVSRRSLGLADLVGWARWPDACSRSGRTTARSEPAPVARGDAAPRGRGPR